MTAVAPRLYLASASPRRRELLTQLGYPFAVLTIHVAEQQAVGEEAATYVERLAGDKARAGWQACGGALPVLGADTIVVLDGRVLEKPRDQADAEQMLAALSGLAFFHPSLFFLSNLFGGGSWARILHPFIGVVMVLAFLGLFVRLWRDNVITDADREWSLITFEP